MSVEKAVWRPCFQAGKCRFFLTQPVTYSGLQRTGCGSPTLGRAACVLSPQIWTLISSRSTSQTPASCLTKYLGTVAQASRYPAWPSQWLFLSEALSLRSSPASSPALSCWEVSLRGLVALAPLRALHPSFPAPRMEGHGILLERDRFHSGDAGTEQGAGAVGSKAWWDWWI